MEDGHGQLPGQGEGPSHAAEEDEAAAADARRARSGAAASSSQKRRWPDALLEEDLSKPESQRVFKRLGMGYLAPRDGEAEAPGLSRSAQLRARGTTFPRLLEVLGVRQEFELVFAAEIAAMREVTRLQDAVARSAEDEAVSNHYCVVMLPSTVQRLDFTAC
jgi:hypothetical protein